MHRATYLLTAAVAAILIGLPTHSPLTSAPREGGRIQVRTEGSPTRGPGDAPLVIVEFTDFECGFCRRSQKIASGLRQKYGARLRWVHKDFPLSRHRRAVAAHLAARCVFREKPGAHAAFFDGVFQGGSDGLDAIALEQRAVKLGVDRAKYRRCLDSHDTKRQIEADIDEGGRLGVRGTPTFVVNGRLVEGAQPIEVFEEALRD